ncbi:putative transporter small subunit [Paracoccus sp. 1_MG-2023]|nr:MULTISPECIES: putative transporter small subunit [unclassified Paracoccus (in: a-proteobacteria)]MBU2957665.1 putative transporter small subunit [Paracoccus sp. C2R09]MDO6667487.1 putative transporter small subunit [Paracoccus sp. 1_MG-2023]
MSPTILTIYAMICPVVVAVVLFVLVRAFLGEWQKARAEGRTII